MNLIPFHPMRNADQLRREINRLYSFPFNLFEDEFTPRLAVPFTDVYETDEEIIVSCDLPGLQRREDVSIQIENNMITISGTLNREQHVIQEDRLHKKERYTGQFRRSVSLPAAVSSDNVRAIYKNGVLNVFLPKTENREKKSVQIEFQH
ncbi:Stress response-like protein HSP [Dehalobacter sp. UNSWDHB]|uniref:Hsp20/alpha crystallin family protein n=1 Tax=unclassified Dehalobacter TaxID=2635733 RepID=UPI00038772BB|nr:MULTISPECIES: Hsp20 family protein [unclassified Dehalobacter]EQB20263.1 Stress response-like protein HSP [Dehalobacter sp. UNSWDHB]RJE47595.1 heat-shock protein Hsp20 [Dehalobacter sp. MCB1]TCX56359.1 heat-shock protein Hsp20 [Dehalobacter sp. 12DCB1]